MDSSIIIAVVSFALGWMSFKLRINFAQWRVARYAKKRGVFFMAHSVGDVRHMFNHIDMIADQQEIFDLINGGVDDEHNATNGHSDSDSSHNPLH